MHPSFTHNQHPTQNLPNISMRFLAPVGRSRQCKCQRVFRKNNLSFGRLPQYFPRAGRNANLFILRKPHDSTCRFERKAGQKQRPHSGHKTGPKSVKADRPSYFWDQFCGQNTAAILKLLLDVRHKLCEASKQIQFNMGTHQCWPRKFAFLRLKTK